MRSYTIFFPTYAQESENHTYPHFSLSCISLYIFHHFLYSSQILNSLVFKATEHDNFCSTNNIISHLSSFLFLCDVCCYLIQPSPCTQDLIHYISVHTTEWRFDVISIDFRVPRCAILQCLFSRDTLTCITTLFTCSFHSFPRSVVSYCLPSPENHTFRY